VPATSEDDPPGPKSSSVLAGERHALRVTSEAHDGTAVRLGTPDPLGGYSMSPDGYDDTMKCTADIGPRLAAHGYQNGWWGGWGS